MNRRDFLRMAASGVAVAAVPSVVLAEPVKRFWQVGADVRSTPLKVEGWACPTPQETVEDLQALAIEIARGQRPHDFVAQWWTADGAGRWYYGRPGQQIHMVTEWRKPFTPAGGTLL